MTKEEIRKFLYDTKVYVNGKSEEIQKKLFSLGYNWHDRGTSVSYTKAPFLFIYSDMSITQSNNMEHFRDHENREITAEEILSLELTVLVYRPFKSQEECWKEMHKHPDFGWIVSKNGLEFCHICDMFTSTSNSLMITLGIDQSNPYEADKYFNNYTFTDGTPFGIKEE